MKHAARAAIRTAIEPAIVSLWTCLDAGRTAIVISSRRVYSDCILLMAGTSRLFAISYWAADAEVVRRKFCHPIK